MGAEEYVRCTKAITFTDGKPYVIHTNTVEGYYSIFKRGMKSVYLPCSEKDPHRYLSEFNFRYSNRIRLGIDDAMRTDKALEGVKRKWLTYRPTVKPTTLHQMATRIWRKRRKRLETATLSGSSRSNALNNRGRPKGGPTGFHFFHLGISRLSSERSGDGRHKVARYLTQQPGDCI